MEIQSTNLSNAAEIRYLNPDNTFFQQTHGNLLSVQIEDEVYEVVYLHCSFPHTNKNIYISVRTIENKEVGMIKALNDFSRETAELLEKFIQMRYFAPEITRVIRIKEEFGYSYWETETTAGMCRFTVRSRANQVKYVSQKRLLIMDVDGNRFIIPDFHLLSDKELRMVELVM